jgi:predicted NACHT family NTPase
VKQHVVKALAIGSPPAFPKADRFVEQALKHKGLLLLLDGLDEVNGANRASVIQRVRDFLHEHECRAIITCRTAVYHSEFANEVERTLEVREFSDQQIRSFLEGWKDHIPAEKSIEQLIQTLRDRPQILVLARNPLLLSIIAYLYTNPRFVLPHSRAEFYQEATDILLRKLDQARLQNNFPAPSKAHGIAASGTVLPDQYQSTTARPSECGL